MWTGHCEGAAHLLKARQYQQPQDDFEYKLLLSLRGPVVRIRPSNFFVYA
jgi:hypothetical protein